jgi:hypothetical protein
MRQAGDIVQLALGVAAGPIRVVVRHQKADARTHPIVRLKEDRVAVGLALDGREERR